MSNCYYCHKILTVGSLPTTRQLLICMNDNCNCLKAKGNRYTIERLK